MASHEEVRLRWRKDFRKRLRSAQETLQQTVQLSKTQKTHTRAFKRYLEQKDREQDGSLVQELAKLSKLEFEALALATTPSSLRLDEVYFSANEVSRAFNLEVHRQRRAEVREVLVGSSSNDATRKAYENCSENSAILDIRNRFMNLTKSSRRRLLQELTEEMTEAPPCCSETPAMLSAGLAVPPEQLPLRPDPLTSSGQVSYQIPQKRKYIEIESGTSMENQVGDVTNENDAVTSEQLGESGHISPGGDAGDDIEASKSRDIAKPNQTSEENANEDNAALVTYGDVFVLSPDRAHQVLSRASDEIFLTIPFSEDKVQKKSFMTVWMDHNVAVTCTNGCGRLENK